jgi:membrane protein YdbS with pleckstrin-like domain
VQKGRLTLHQHGIVLARPLTRALVVAGAGLALVSHGWPVSPLGAAALALAAVVALRAVWRWERTVAIVTQQELRLSRGTLRRRTRTVSRAAIGPVEVEQSLFGRLFDYGTVFAGGLELRAVARPRELARLLAQLPGTSGRRDTESGLPLAARHR